MIDDDYSRDEWMVWLGRQATGMVPTLVPGMLVFVIGALVATVIGFALDVASGTSGILFSTWLLHPLVFRWLAWPLIGGAVAALSYIVWRMDRHRISN